MCLGFGLDSLKREHFERMVTGIYTYYTSTDLNGSSLALVLYSVSLTSASTSS